ncbi:DUF459 domain-containing protein [Actinospongicola halichondriae]|uniref:DUF459 domain-containing protein n=1 Tax=Actinospongicola halichondriae TaxID=3236844 RepID=UPI003D3D049C
MPRLGHLPQLDGLRAVAVVAVLLFHGAVPWSTGGFLGVDLFFVVSGFLITALLLEEASGTGHVDVADFYRRRIRRLLPAMIGVVAVVVGFAVVFSSAQQGAAIRRDALGAVSYSHNWVQIVADASYFGGFEGPSPLRHLWSLSIEEQWYLVWPVVVLGCRRLTPDPRRLVGVVAGSLFFASAIWMVVSEARGASIDRLYYGTDTRLQAVAIGALLATTGVAGASRWRNSAARVVAPAALAGTLTMFVLVDGSDRWLYRGGFTVFALLAAVLVAAIVGPGPIATAFSHPVLVGIGRMSYSLYLWHWPIYLGVTPATTDLDGPALLLLRLALSFGAAGLSYAVIEQRIRVRSISTRRAAGLLGASAIVAVIAALAITPSRSETVAAAEVSSRSVDADTAPTPDRAVPRVLVLGDSIAYTFTLYVEIEPLGARFARINGGLIGCGLVEAAGTIGTGFVDDEPGCADRYDQWDAMMSEHEPDIVMVMVGGWEIFDRVVDGSVIEVGSPPWRDEIGRQLDTVLALARGHGASTLLATVPCFDAPDLGLPGDTAAIRNDRARVEAVNDLLRATAVAEADVDVLDVGSVVCPEGVAVDAIDGVPIRRDGIHYTVDGATKVWSVLMDELNAVVEATEAVGDPTAPR